MVGGTPLFDIQVALGWHSEYAECLKYPECLEYPEYLNMLLTSHSFLIVILGHILVHIRLKVKTHGK